MITVSKLDPQGNVKTRYEGKIVERRAQGIVLLAEWTRPVYDLGYTCFEPGDCFTEYYYTDRWFNIFSITDVQGKRKGWYCDIAEPAVITDDQIKQVDLLLDVWVSEEGEPLILDEDEFAQGKLSAAQRQGAEQGLRELLRMLAACEDAFASLKAKQVEQP